MNPADYTKRPTHEGKEVQVFTAEQAIAFLEAARADRYHALWALALSAGPRPEEYLALQWPDINLDKGEAKIQRALLWNRKGDLWRFGPLKTKKSRRIITFPAEVSQALVEHRQRQMEERIRLARRYVNHQLVFASASEFHPGAQGGPLRLGNLRNRHMTPTLERAALPTSYHPYCLRHSYATLALAAGIEAKVVSEMLGHSSVAFTLDTYAHVIPSMRDVATEKIKNMLFR